MLLSRSKCDKKQYKEKRRRYISFLLIDREAITYCSYNLCTTDFIIWILVSCIRTTRHYPQCIIQKIINVVKKISFGLNLLKFGFSHILAVLNSNYVSRHYSIRHATAIKQLAAFVDSVFNDGSFFNALEGPLSAPD